MKTLPIIAILWLAALLLVGCVQETATVSPISPPPTPVVTELPPINWASAAVTTGTHTVMLPKADKCNCNCDEPSPPFTGTLRIYDFDGALSDWEWLRATFGNVNVISDTTNTARLTTLFAIDGDAPATLVVHANHPNVTVVLHWPDAPLLPVELRACGLDRGVYGPTNDNGDIGFGLGGGSYYWPPDGGPHTIWIGGVDGTDCASGLGMLGETNHWHLNSWFQLSDQAVEGLVDWGFSPTVARVPVEYGSTVMWVIQVP